jgi:proline-specific peptidase
VTSVLADRAQDSGRISVPGGQVAYWVIGRDAGNGRLPLLTLHGGPGLTHNYLETLADLADERRVIFFDQLGCGDSGRPGDRSLWTVERAVDEVECVREALGLNQFHLFGNSWGGWLALSYVLSHPLAGPAGLVLSSCPPDTGRFVDYCWRLRAELPGSTAAALKRHEDAGWFRCPEYQAAVWEFYRRHLCRLEPWPRGLEISFETIGEDVYEAMWGPSEFGPLTGVLNGWSVSDRLTGIPGPVLVTAGRYDEASPDQCREMSESLPGGRFQLFEQSSHMAFYEQREEYIDCVRGFLRTCERRGPRQHA